MRYLSLRAFVLATFLITGTTAISQGSENTCGTEKPCEIEGGVYYTALPEKPQGAPVVLWLHGYGGRAEKSRAGGMARTFTEQGYVFVAPQGMPDPAKPDQRDWNVRDGYEEPRDDVVFLSAVLDDVTARFATNSDRILLIGFSRGASMAWDYACAKPERISALAVAAGGFWEPMVQSCAGPVNLFHTHGFNDRTVPLEGRKVSWGGHKFHQGNIMKGLDVWREVNGCTGAADKNTTDGKNWEKRWTKCQAGSVRLQITPGGHGIPKGWSRGVLEWFEEVSPAQS